MTGEEWRFCKKCLIRDLDEGALFESVKEYLASLDESVKAPQEEYERRLSLCRECDRLVRGTCTVCGCYVEMRAAGKDRHCPAVKEKW
ncbi:MAG: DUF6171 family protein [Lachnospiraceae bacterium]|nr:DUF6171 family protein [Lachnospiraceae bacterium]